MAKNTVPPAAFCDILSKRKCGQHFAFGFDYPWDDSVTPHSLPGFPKGWRWDDDFVDALARFAGFSHLRFNGESPWEEVLSTMKGAIDADFPTLLRLEDEMAWTLAVGYEGDIIYALDSQLHALPDDRKSSLGDAIVTTGNTTPRMSYKEFLERVESALSYEEHEALESKIMHALDHVTAENARDTAAMMCGINSVPIEVCPSSQEGM